MVTGPMWWHTSVILVPRELRQGNWEFEASVGKSVRSCLEKRQGTERGEKEKREKDKTAGKASGQC